MKTKLAFIFTAPCKRKEEGSASSNNNNNNNNNANNTTPKKPRLVFTDLQRRTLQAIFKVIFFTSFA